MAYDALTMRTADLDFDLPSDLIATTAAEPRDSARLMVCDRASGRVEHHRVSDLPSLGIFQPGDLMVTNHTRVLRARLTGIRRATSGRVRGLLLSHVGRRWTLLLESGGKPQPGEHIDLDGSASLELLERGQRGSWAAHLHGPLETEAVLEAVGRTPLPPYILAERKRQGLPDELESDWHRYNTVFSQTPGSVAAPTAGLHLTPQILDAIQRVGVTRSAVTLDIGLGTFEPVRTDTLEDHAIHREKLHVPAETIADLKRAKQSRGRVLAVGTTTVRAIESLPALLPAGGGDFTCETELFITPDFVASGRFAWRFTDRLMTNFHLPQSTLLAMVAALPGVGLERLLRWYAAAIDERYRFYSFGDAMLIV